MIFEKRNKSERQGQRNKYRQQTEASNVSQNNNKGVADLIDVNLNTSEFSKKGGLKTSEHEQILKGEYFSSFCKIFSLVIDGIF